MAKLALVLSFIISIFISHPLNAANDIFRAGARHSAMGYGSVGIYDVWSNFNNQAGLGYVKNPEIGLFHEQRFSASEINQNSLAISLPTKAGTFGLNATYFGLKEYYESKFGLALGKSFGKKVSAGLQFDYLHNYLEQYESGGNYTFEAGMIAQPLKNVFLEFHWFNPTQATLTKNTEETYPTVISLGAGTILDEVLIIGCKLEKFNDRDLNTRIGMSYLLIEKLSLSMGYATEPNVLSFGMGYYISGWKFDLALSNHQPKSLGLTTSVSLSYAF